MLHRMLRTRRALLEIAALVVALTVAGSKTLLAGENQVPSAPFAHSPHELLKLVDAKRADGAHVDVFLDETRIRVDQDGRRTVSYWKIYQILDRSSYDGWGSIEHEWSPSFQHAPELRARVIRPDGRVEELDPGAVFDTPSHSDIPQVYSDAKLRSAPLPGLVPGCIVETHSVVEDFEPLFSGGLASVRRFLTFVPIRTSRYVLEFPKSVRQRFMEENLPDSVHKSKQRDGELYRFTYEMPDIPVLDFSSQSFVQDFENAPTIGFSTGDSWREVARTYLDEIEPLVFDEVLRPDVARILEKTRSRLETIHALSRAVRERVRYTGVAFGKSRIIPARPQAVLERQFGDCKDQAALLVTMLEIAGIEARIALVATELPAQTVEGLPGIGHFDHAVVFVPGNEPLWIDTTAEYAGVGQVPPTLQGKAALVIDHESSNVVRMPRSTAADNRLVETRIVRFPIEGPVSVTERTEATGAAAYGLRWQFDNNTDSETEDWLEQYARNTYGCESTASYSLSDPRDLETPFVLTLDFPATEIAAVSASDAYVAIDYSPLFGQIPAELFGYYDADGEVERDRVPAERDFGYARSMRIEYVVEPPPHFSVLDPPTSEERRCGPVTTAVGCEPRADGSWLLFASFELAQSNLTRDEIVEVLLALDDLFGSNPPVLMLTYDGETLLAEGSIDEALQLARAEADSFARAILPRERMANALLAAGLGWPARETLRHIVNEEPDSPAAHLAYARVLQHDLAGRELKPGMDRQGAIRELRRVLSLDTENIDAAWQLVTLLSCNDDAVMYGIGSDLDAAREQALAAYEMLPIPDQEFALVRLLAATGKLDDMRKLTPNLLNEGTRDAARLVVSAIEDGAARALRRAVRLRPEAYRRAVITEASGYLLFAGELEAASKFMDAALTGTVLDSTVEALIEMLKAAAEATVAQDAPEGPESAAFRMFEIFLGSSKENYGHVGAKEFRKLVANNEKALTTMARFGTMIVGAIQQEAEIPPTILSQLFKSNLVFKSEGDDDFGHRVWMSFSHGPDVKLPFCYVVREKDQYRILAFPADPSPVGLRMWSLLDDGRLEDAERWAQWIGDRSFSSGPWSKSFERAPHFQLLELPSEPDESDLRLAAATVILPHEGKEVARVARDALEELPEPVRRQGWHDYLLALALCSQGRHSEAQSHLESTWRSRLARNAMVEFLSACYMHDKSYAKALALLPTMEQKNVSPEFCRRIEADVALRQGKFEAAARLYDTMLQEAPDDPQLVNQFLWAHFCAGTLSSEHADQAAAILEKDSHSHYLAHTVASVYAELGMFARARDMVRRVAQSRGSGELDSSDWFLYGLVAEKLGETRTARHAYDRAKDLEDNGNAASCASLAHTRLARLKQP